MSKEEIGTRYPKVKLYKEGVLIFYCFTYEIV